MPSSVSVSRKMILLGEMPGFSALPPTVIADLADRLREEAFEAGAVITQEGERADRLYLIVRGQAVVVSGGGENEVELARLEPGGLFGEIALLSEDRLRKATVRATGPMTTLSLSAGQFDEVMRIHPEVRLELVTMADAQLSAKFLKMQVPPEARATRAGDAPAST